MEIITTYKFPKKLLSAFRLNPVMPSRNRRVRSNPLKKNTDLCIPLNTVPLPLRHQTLPTQSSKWSYTVVYMLMSALLIVDWKPGIQYSAPTSFKEAVTFRRAGQIRVSLQNWNLSLSGGKQLILLAGWGLIGLTPTRQWEHKWLIGREVAWFGRYGRFGETCCRHLQWRPVKRNR